MEHLHPNLLLQRFHPADIGEIDLGTLKISESEIAPNPGQGVLVLIVIEEEILVVIVLQIRVVIAPITPKEIPLFATPLVPFLDPLHSQLFLKGGIRHLLAHRDRALVEVRRQRVIVLTEIQAAEKSEGRCEVRFLLDQGFRADRRF